MRIIGKTCDWFLATWIKLKHKDAYKVAVLNRKNGQASVEYLVVCTAIVVAGLVITIGSQTKCVTNIRGDMVNCTSANEAIQSAFRKNIEDITFLINLPF